MKALFGNGRSGGKKGGGGTVSRGARQGGGNGRLFQPGSTRGGAAPRNGAAGFLLGRGSAGNGRGRG